MVIHQEVIVNTFKHVQRPMSLSSMLRLSLSFSLCWTIYTALQSWSIFMKVYTLGQPTEHWSNVAFMFDLALTWLPEAPNQVGGNEMSGWVLASKSNSTLHTGAKATCHSLTHLYLSVHPDTSHLWHSHSFTHTEELWTLGLVLFTRHIVAE